MAVLVADAAFDNSSIPLKIEKKTQLDKNITYEKNIEIGYIQCLHNYL